MKVVNNSNYINICNFEEALKIKNQVLRTE